MNINDLKQHLPDYAKDLKINLGNVLDSEQHEHLNASQVWGTALATALASRNKALIEAVEAQAREVLDAEYFKAAKAAAAIMGMNNVYYRFVHLASAKDYKTLPAKLRMNVIANPGVDKGDFELWSLAVSAINGCGMCIDAHENELRKAGLSAEQIQAAVRIASVVAAAAAIVKAEKTAA